MKGIRVINGGRKKRKISPGVYTGLYDTTGGYSTSGGTPTSGSSGSSSSTPSTPVNPDEPVIEYITATPQYTVVGDYVQMSVIGSDGSDLSGDSSYELPVSHVLTAYQNAIVSISSEGLVEGLAEGFSNVFITYQNLSTETQVTVYDFNRRICWYNEYYDFDIIGIGNLTDGVTTDADSYADDVSNKLTKYGFKELVTLYNDDLNQKKPVNITHRIGPIIPETTEGQFNCTWTMYSDVINDSGLYMKNLTTDTVYKMAELYPAYADYYEKSYTICNFAYDMSGSAVVSIETAVDEITTIRVFEGATTWEGYSPLVICNITYVNVEYLPSYQFDSIVLYLKDTDLTTVGWNYDTVTNPVDQLSDNQDLRRSNTIYLRFQRNNFDTEYIAVTTDFDIAYIENAWFNGNPNDSNLDNVVGIEFKLYISVRGRDRSRKTFESAVYFYTESKYVPEISESIDCSVAITGNSVETIGDHIYLDDSVIGNVGTTGVLMDMVLSENIGIEPLNAAVNISGSLFNIVIPTDVGLETSIVSSAITGVCADTIIASEIYTDDISPSVSISGSIETE